MPWVANLVRERELRLESRLAESRDILEYYPLLTGGMGLVEPQGTWAV